LTRESDFIRFTGRRVRVTTHQPIDGRRRFSGVLEGFAEGRVVLKIEDAELVEIPLEDVARARLEIDL
jgi:ribosome maturation factor RimP